MQEIDPATAAIRWLPFFKLVPSHRAGGRPDPTIIDVSSEQAWTIHEALLALARMALHWHLCADAWPRAKARVTERELDQWAAQTRALADGVSFGDATRNVLLEAVAHLEKVRAAPARLFLREWPALGTQADAKRRASLHLWGMDRLLRTFNAVELTPGREGLETLDFPVTKVWPAMFEEAEPEAPPFSDYKEAQKRFKRIEEDVKEGQHDNLMVLVLRGALTSYPATTPK